MTPTGEAQPASPSTTPLKTTGRQLGNLTSPEVAAAGFHTLLIPLGATEQHGAHLALSTDTVIASAWAAAAAEQLDGTAVAPALPYGASGEHQGFPGTLSIGTDALVSVIVELARSAKHDVGRVVFVSGHAGNLEALQRAIGLLRSEGHDAHFVVPRLAGADAHAGHTETSLMAHLSPAHVQPELAVPGACEPLADLIDDLRSGGLRHVTSTGVLGDPTTATPAEGSTFFNQLVSDLVTSLAD